MRVKKDVLADSISYSTIIKLPVGIIAGGLVSIAIYAFAQWQQHLQYENERFTAEREYINATFEAARAYTDSKTQNRYTAHEATKFAEQIKQRFSDVSEKNNAEHRSLQRQLTILEKKCSK